MSTIRTITAEDLGTLGRRGAVEAMRRFLRVTAAGRAFSPPREEVRVGDRRLVFTVGGSAEADVAGFRMYSIGPGPRPDGPTQLLGLMRHSTGEILAIATGAEFGAWRTAAIGGVALLASTSGPLRVGILGAGVQAAHHARTWADVAQVVGFRVWARRPEAAREFAGALARETGVPTSAAGSAADSVRDADAVLAATSSPDPVAPAEAFARDVYVAAVGPKFGDRAELPAGLYADAAFLLTDAPAQASRLEEDRGPLPGGRRAEELADLALVVAGGIQVPPGGRRIFVSEGLAGTEVALLEACLRVPPR